MLTTAKYLFKNPHIRSLFSTNCPRAVLPIRLSDHSTHYFSTSQQAQAANTKISNNEAETNHYAQQNVSSLGYEELTRQFPHKKSKGESKFDPNQQYKIVKEGASNVVIGSSPGSDEASQSTAIKSEAFIRDMNVMIFSAYANELKKNDEKFNGIELLEAYPEAGISTFRLLTEMQPEDIKRITVIDNHKIFSLRAEENMELNQIPKDTSKLAVEEATAQAVLFNRSKYIPSTPSKPHLFSVIDLNSFGNPSKYLDFAFMGIQKNGLVCVTYSDLLNAGERDPKKELMDYGLLGARAHDSHEIGLRVAFSSLNANANRRDKMLFPLLSFALDDCFRIYAKVSYSKSACQTSIAKNSMVLECTECPNIEIIPLVQENKAEAKAHSSKCSVCDSRLRLTGPVWSDKLYDIEFVKNIQSLYEASPETYKHTSNVKKLVDKIIKNAGLDQLQHSYNITAISKFLRVPQPPSLSTIKIALINQGFEVKESYLHKDYCLTNAPSDVVFDIIKGWRKQIVPQDKWLSDVENKSAAFRALKKPIRHTPNFERLPNVDYDRDI